MEQAYEEDELLPISNLQHLLFCPRRAAMVYTEGLWDDNVFTMEGTILHSNTDQPETEVRGDLRIARGLRLRSLRLGLIGRADVVEFHRSTADKGGTVLDSVPGFWQPTPVEYKRGRLRKEEGYEIQLCAQALCLEEMLKVEIPSGAIYYGKTRRRLDIAFDAKLRRDTEVAIKRLHELISSGKTPPAEYSKRCQSCSLIDTCLPKATGKKGNVERYLAKAIAEAGGFTNQQ